MEGNEMKNSKRVGWKMKMAANIASDHPGLVMMDLARAVGPNGYAIVHRAIAAGLLRKEPMENRKRAFRVYAA